MKKIQLLSTINKLYQIIGNLLITLEYESGLEFCKERYLYDILFTSFHRHLNWNQNIIWIKLYEGEFQLMQKNKVIYNKINLSELK